MRQSTSRASLTTFVKYVHCCTIVTKISHYETQLNIHFEYVEGYIKALKKKNITDEEREKVKKSLCFCASYKLFPSKEKEKRTTIQLTDVFFLCPIHTLLSRLALFPTVVSHPFTLTLDF